MIIKNANVYQEDGQFHEDSIFMNQGVFIEGFSADTHEFDASGCYAIPGLIDIHLHGCLGADICDGNLESLRKIAEYEASVGVTTIVPATMTSRWNPQSAVLRKIRRNALGYTTMQAE